VDNARAATDPWLNTPTSCDTPLCDS
jgi:hypothetical protein